MKVYKVKDILFAQFYDAYKFAEVFSDLRDVELPDIDEMDVKGDYGPSLNKAELLDIIKEAGK